MNARRYDLKTTDEKILWQKRAEDVEELFKSGKIDLETKCRMTGLREWFELNEFFPTLKYHTSASYSADRSAAPETRGVYLDDRGVPAKTSALIAGWIFFGLGLAIAWIFPPAHFFYSVAIILAIICMCTHQVKRGLVLLLVTFAGAGLSALIFFAIVVGTATSEVAPGLAEARNAVERAQTAMNQQVQSLNQALPPPSFRTGDAQRSTSFPAPMEPDRPLDSWTQSELLAEISRLEAIQRDARKSGRQVPSGTVQRMQKVQAAYDRVTLPTSR